MLPSKRSKQIIFINERHGKVASKKDQRYDAEEEEPTIKYEPDSANEQELDMLATSNESHITELNMTCSDSEDSFGTSADGCSVSQPSHNNKHPESTIMPVMPRAKNAIPSKEPSLANILDILITVSEHIKEMQGKTESIQKEVSSISNRMARVEKKVGISLATMEQVKHVIVQADTSLGNEANRQAAFRFDFKAISNEEELMEFDSKLGNDEEYYSNVKQWFTMQINVTDPDNRMHIAMDLVFDRAFLPLCSWRGNGKPAPKIPLGARTNIMKLFADIGSNQYITVNELFVQKFFLKKLPHAKHRINLKGGRNVLCLKRKSTKT